MRTFKQTSQPIALPALRLSLASLITLLMPVIIGPMSSLSCHADENTGAANTVIEDSRSTKNVAPKKQDASPTLDAPISIEADSAEQDEKQGLTIYKGNVDMRQGPLRIHASRIEIHSTPNSRINERQVGHILASGEPATFTHDGIQENDAVTAQAAEISYQPKLGVVMLRGDASLAQRGSSVKGDQIEYFIAAKTVKAAASPQSKGRVKTIIKSGQAVSLPAPTAVETE